jgi:signal transduction histidine kinase
MIKKGIYQVTLLTLLLISATRAFAQYTDHRDYYHKLDSLEQVLATNPPEGKDLGFIYRDLMYGYLQVDNEKSMNYARKCIEIVTSLDGWMIVRQGYLILGLNHYGTARYDSALVYYNKALEATERMRNSSNNYTEWEIDEGLSATYGNMGNVYNMQGMLYETVAYYVKALRLFEKHNRKESLVYLNGNIGAMYLAMENNEQAKGYFLAADSLAQVTGDSLMIAAAKKHLSDVFMQTEDYAAALDNAWKAYDYYSVHPEEASNLVGVQNTLAQIYLDGYNDVTRAETYINQALALAKTDEVMTVTQAASLGLLAEIYLKKSEWSKAEQTALEALATDDSEPSNTISLYDILSKAYTKLGNSDKAWEYMDKHSELQSVWSNKHYQSAIRDMEVKYETEKKETQIVSLESEKRQMMWLSIAGGAAFLLALVALILLWRWTVQRKRLADNQIKQLEQEKQLIATQAVLDGEIQERIRLARDLHDGLGSMLTGLKFNIELLKGAAFSQDEAKCFGNARKILDDSMIEMRRVAHHLMPASLTRNGLKTALKEFCDSFPIIEFGWFGSDENLGDRNREVMIYRMIHELVNNALKHSGAQKIGVNVMREPDYIAFTVFDNGKGFDLSTDPQGMGLASIRERVASCNGRIEISSTVGKGTEVNVEIQNE